jgi:hypothetical protein
VDTRLSATSALGVEIFMSGIGERPEKFGVHSCPLREKKVVTEVERRAGRDEARGPKVCEARPCASACELDAG